MTELAHHSTDYSVVEREPPEVMARNLRVASQLWASATVFFFFAFLFAYFYLRSLNSPDLWHPQHVEASVTLGTVIILCVVARRRSSLPARAPAVAPRTGRRGAGWRSWRLSLGLAAVVLQIVEWATIGFGPTEGGFASVFLGWTGLYILFVFGIDVLARDAAGRFVRYRGLERRAVRAGRGLRRRRANR